MTTCSVRSKTRCFIGFSDFPTWAVSTGQSGIDKFYPAGLQFGVLGSAPAHPNVPYPDRIAIMSHDVAHPDWTPLVDQYFLLKQTVSRPGLRRRTWDGMPGEQRVASLVY
jgi:hypothetical protein